MNLADAKPTTGRRQILLLGKSGAGKTTFLRSMPKPLYVFDFDCKGEHILAGIDGELDHYDGPEAWAGAKAKIEELQKECPFATVAIDSLSMGGDSTVEWAKLQNGNRSFRVSPEDWGRAISEVKAVIRQLKKLQTNLVVNCHFNVERDEMLGGLIWEPAIFGTKLPGQLPTFFNDVWLLRVLNKQEGTKTVTSRVLQLSPDQRFDMLKNSGNGKWAAEEAPDFSKLMNKLNQE